MKRALFLTLIASLSACADPVQNDVDCGEGDPLTFRDQTYCVFEQSIIETGFECPPQSPHRFDIEGGAVCAQTPDTPDIDEIAERVRQGWDIDEPTDPTLCDDDTQITCDQTREETVCPGGQISAAINGCYQCVVADTCMPAPLPGGDGRLQLLHHMPGATTATVDVYVNGALTYDDLPYRDGSALVDVPLGELMIEIRDGAGAQTLGSGTLTVMADTRHVALLAGTSDPVTVTGQMAQAPQVVDLGAIPDLPPSVDYFATTLASASLLTTPFDVRSDNDMWTLLLDDAVLGSVSELHVLDALTDDLGGGGSITKAFALTEANSTDQDMSRYFSGFLDVTDRGGQFGIIVLSPTQDNDVAVPAPEFILHGPSGGPGLPIVEGL